MNKELGLQLERLQQSIDNRKRSEKILVLALFLAAIVLIWLSLLADPMTVRLESLQSQINSVNGQIQAQQQAYNAMLEQSQEDPNRYARERLEVVTREQARLDQQIASRAGDLVTPAQMTNILVDVLQQQQGLELIAFRNQPARAMRTGISDTVANSSGTTGEQTADTTERLSGQVYEHGLILEFTGDFFSTLEYLLYLERMTGSFFWDSISFQRENWPLARVTLQIHTISADQGFIGV